MLLKVSFLCISILITLRKSYVKSSLVSSVQLIKSYVEKQVPVHVSYYTCWEKQQINKFIDEMVNSKITFSVSRNFSKLSETKLQQHALIITDTNCVQFQKLLEIGHKLNLFRPPYKWLIFNVLNNSIPASSNILLDSNVAIATQISKNEYHLKLIYKYNKSTEFVYNDLAKFSINFAYYNQFLLALNRTNLMGTNLRVPYVLTTPEQTLDIVNYRNNHINSISKLSLALVTAMLEMLNCTTNFVKYETWGYKEPNATYYDGMFGDLQNGTGEIAGTASFYTLSRMEIVQYVSVTTPSSMKFILRAPPLSYVQNLYTLPFEVNIWYGLFIITVFTILILYVLVIFESKNKQWLKKASNVDRIQPTLFDVVLVQVGAITQQGTEAEPKSLAGRIVVFIVFLLLMFFYTAYSANIVVLLQSASKDIRTVDDLLNSNVELGVEDIVYSRFYFENQKESVRRTIYETKIAPKGQEAHYLHLREGIARVRNEFYGFHCETTTCYKEVMETFHEHEKCGLIEVDYLNFLYPSLCVRKHSPYFEIVKVAYRKICESGIKHRQTTRIYHQKPKCSGKSGTYTSVGIRDAYFPLVMFFIGTIFSLWVLIIEILFKKYFNWVNWSQNLKPRWIWPLERLFRNIKVHQIQVEQNSILHNERRKC